MELTETRNEGLEREFKVVVPATEFESRLMERLTELGKTVNLPGFRPGKVPVKILRQKYGDSVKGEILEQTISNTWQQAVTESGLRPAMDPKIEIVTFEEGSDLEYKMAFEVVPEFEMMDFSTIALERRVADIPDEEIEAALERLAANLKEYEPAPDGHEAADGDKATIDFEGSIDGVPFDGGKGEDYPLEIGGGRFIPGFEEQLKGAKAGESREVSVSFPEDYGAADLAGKDAVFAVTVKSVEVPKAAKIDDEMAKKMGAESLDDLRERVRQQIESDYAGVTRARLKRELLDALSEGHDFALPPGMVEREFESVWSQVGEARERGELGEEDEGKSEDELKAEYRVIAERRVRLGLLLSEIARTNELTVTQEEVNRAIAEQARYMPGREREVQAYYMNNPEAMQQLQGPIFEDKVMDFVLEMAQITERRVPAEDLTKDPDDAADASEKKAKPAKRAAKPKAKPKAKSKAKSAKDEAAEK